MGYLDIQRILQNNPALQAAQTEKKTVKTDGAKDYDAIINSPKDNLNVQDEWKKAEQKPSETKTPVNTGISGGGGATEGSSPVDNNNSANAEGNNQNKFEFDKDGNLITYPKNGENFKKTAQRLGLKPGTPEYNAFVQANPKAGKRNYFVIGDQVKIPPSIQDKINKTGIINKEEGMSEVNNYNTNNPTPVRQSRSAASTSGAASTAANKKYPKNVQDRIDALKKNGEKFEVIQSKNGYYDIKVTDSNYLKKNGIGEIAIKYDPKGQMLSQTNKYNNGKIVETTYAGGKKVKTLANPAPKEYQDMAAQVKKKYGGNIRLEYNDKIKKYVIVQTNIPNSNIKEKRIVVDAKAWQEKMSKTDAVKKGVSDAWNNLKITSPGSYSKAYNAATRNKNSSIKLEDHFLSETTSYNNGKITQSTYKDGKVKSQKTIKAGIQKAAATTGAEAANSATTVKGREKLHTSTDISFKMPKNAPKNAETFANALIDNKEKLMRQLNIDNDTYNMLAQTAIGIAKQETNFGEKTGRQRGKDILRLPSDSVAWVQNKLGMENNSTVSDWSQGMTQLKFTLHRKDDIVRKNLDAVGITNELQLQDPETSAIATMVVLARLNQEIDSPENQKGIKAAQGTEVKLEGYEFDSKTNASKKTADGSTKPWTNNITRQDVLCAFWNGADRASVKNGTFKPAVSTYSNNVRRYTQEYKLEENKASRAAAVEKNEATRPMIDANRNNGDIGGVVFMPAMYTDKAKHTNSVSEIRQLRETLTKKGIDPNLRNQLISAMQNGELGFDFGLKQSEIEALTNADIKLILKHLDKVKKTVNSDTSINTSDGINAQEARTLRTKYGTSIGRSEDNFRKEYLNNHSKVYNASDNNKKVLRETSTNTGSKNYVNGNGERRGFKHEKARGVNTNTSRGQISSQAKALADAAHNVVMQNPDNTSSGQCLTGVKNAMRAAGIDVSGMADT